jgi:hypothetical protein
MEQNTSPSQIERVEITNGDLIDLLAQAVVGYEQSLELRGTGATRMIAVAESTPERSLTVGNLLTIDGEVRDQVPIDGQHVELVVR